MCQWHRNINKNHKYHQRNDRSLNRAGFDITFSPVKCQLSSDNITNLKTLVDIKMFAFIQLKIEKSSFCITSNK